MAWVGREPKNHPVPTCLPWSGTPSARPGCSKLHPAWPCKRRRKSLRPLFSTGVQSTIKGAFFLLLSSIHTQSTIKTKTKTKKQSSERTSFKAYINVLIKVEFRLMKPNYFNKCLHTGAEKSHQNWWHSWAAGRTHSTSWWWIGPKISHVLISRKITDRMMLVYRSNTLLIFHFKYRPNFFWGKTYEQA